MQTLAIGLALLVCASSAWGAACAQPQPTVATDASVCEPDQRRAEARRLATRRLDALRRALARVARQRGEVDGELAVAKTGRPAPWCEALLNDVLAMRNIDVVDDETVRGPQWIESIDANGRRELLAAPVLDPAFIERRVGERDVVQGYVTLRWRAEDLLTLRVVASCAEAGPETTGCHPSHRSAAAHVYDAVLPYACTAAFYERSHLTNWKEVLTPVRLDLPFGRER